MMNRGWSVMLLLAAVMGVPSGVSAQENDEYEVTVTIGEPTPARVTDGRCPAYLTSDRDEAPYSGALQFEQDTDESRTSTFNGSAGSSILVASATVNSTETSTTRESYQIGYYDVGDGPFQRVDCRTLSPLL